MALRKLDETLDELHRQLEAAASIDDGERDRLRRAMDEIRQALAKAEGAAPDRDTGPVERLEDFVERFEEDHPTLCARLADLIQSLHNVGF